MSPLGVGGFEQQVKSKKSQGGVQDGQEDGGELVPSRGAFGDVEIFRILEAYKPGSKGKSKKEARKEEGGRGDLGARVKGDRPSRNIEDGACKCAEQETRPRAQGHEQQHGEIEQQHVAEERDFVILAGGNEQRRTETAGYGVEREQFGVLGPGEVAVEGSDGNHGHEGDGSRNEAIEGESCPEGEIEGAAADGFEGIRKGGVVAGAKAFGPYDEGGAGDQSDEDAAEGADPMIVDRQFEKPGHADEYCQDPDAVKPL